MIHFWRVLRIGITVTITGILVDSHGGSLDTEQLLAINGLAVGIVESIFRYFVPPGSVSSVQEIETVVKQAVDSALKEKEDASGNRQT